MKRPDHQDDDEPFSLLIASTGFTLQIGQRSFTRIAPSHRNVTATSQALSSQAPPFSPHVIISGDIIIQLLQELHRLDLVRVRTDLAAAHHSLVLHHWTLSVTSHSSNDKKSLVRQAARAAQKRHGGTIRGRSGARRRSDLAHLFAKVHYK